ncbi:MAG: hypothetical protein NC434_03670 [Ruminococcus sp.]|nr:hypothetical protein [Ruminococcus sp.]
MSKKKEREKIADKIQWHPYELCRRKMNHICEIAVLANSESFILKEIITNSRTYQFGTTDLRFTLCLNKEVDHNGCEKSSCYVVESLREGDCFAKSVEAYTISHIFMKANDEKIYSKLLFMDKGYSIENIPEELKKIVQIE